MNTRCLALVITLLFSTFMLSFHIHPVNASGTIYIRADGSIDPSTAPIQRNGNLYAFIDDIYDEIIVQRGNIIIDGNGYTLQGSGGGYGFSLYGTNNVAIKRTTIREFYGGVSLSSSSYNVLFGNNITANTKVGVELSYSYHAVVYENNITANGEDGFWVSSSSNNSIIGNNIAANGEDGISFFYPIDEPSSTNNSILGNNITNNNRAGIVLGYSFYSTICGNNITNNSYGIVPCWYSAENKIYHNNFVNTIQVSLYNSGNNIWDDEYPSGGNYWSDYTGMDADGDGIGDTPYVIDSNNQDRYPLMNPGVGQWVYLFSPIADFSYSPEFPAVNEPLVFNASDSYDIDDTIENYAWNFGDGNVTTTTDPTITHVYTAVGTYQANLTITDNDGLSHSTTKPVIVVVDSTPPTIGTPSRIPDGDVLPDQPVKVSANITDALSQVKNVTLYYTLNNGTAWEEPIPMNHNSSTGLYEATIPGQQQVGTCVRFKITAYDYAGNNATLGGTEPYCVYQVIPEFPSFMILPFFMLFTMLAVVFMQRKILGKQKNSR